MFDIVRQQNKAQLKDKVHYANDPHAK